MPDDMTLLDAPIAPAADAAADTGGDAPAATPAAAEPAAAAQPQAPGGAPGADSATPADAGSIELEYPDDDAPEETEEGGPPEPAAEPAAEPETESAAAARFGTAALTRILKDNPELAKAAEASPRVRAQLYQMARRSQELAAYQDTLPSLAQAKEAAEARSTLDNYDQAYFGQQPEAFWRGLYEASGQTGAYQRQVGWLNQTFLDGVEQQARSAGNEGLSDAVAAIRESLGWGNSRSTPSSQAKGDARGTVDEDNLPPHIRRQLEISSQRERENEQLRTRLSEGERQATERFLDETAGEAGREIRAFVDGILANASLSDYDKANIARDFLEEVRRLGDADKVHNAALDELFRSGGTTPETRAQMVARVKAWTRQNGREILEPILKKAGAGLRQRQQQRAAVASAARREPAASGAPSLPRVPEGRDLVRQKEATLGRRLSDREILDLN